MEMVTNGIIPAIIVIMFGVEIAFRKYKDEEIFCSLYFYMLFFYLTIVGKEFGNGITGHLYYLFLIALCYSVCMQAFYSIFLKKQPKINQ